MKLAKFLCTLLLAAPNIALGHFVWTDVECSSDTRCETRLYFGEYASGLKETAATRLTERAGLEAWVIAGNEAPKPLTLTALSDHFHAAFERQPGEPVTVVAVDRNGAVSDLRKYQIGVVRPVFYARGHVGLHDGAAEFSPSTQALDILPLSPHAAVNTPVSMKFLLHGTPLAQRAEIRVYAPNGWSWEGELSKDGTVTFTPLWEGQYVAEAIVREESPGTFKNQAYEAVRHRATLSLTVSAK